MGATINLYLMIFYCDNQSLKLDSWHFICSSIAQGGQRQAVTCHKINVMTARINFYILVLRKQNCDMSTMARVPLVHHHRTKLHPTACSYSGSLTTADSLTSAQ